MGAVPYVGPEWVLWAYPQQWVDFSKTWFEHSPSHENYFHLIGATKDQLDNDVSIWGWTDAGANVSYVLRESCEASGQELQKTPEEIDNFTMDTTVHEIGHQWDLNCCSSDGHDTRDAWCQAAGGCGVESSDPEKCVENAGLSGTIWDGVSRFCAEDLFLGDPTCTRGAIEEGQRGRCDMVESSLRTASEPR